LVERAEADAAAEANSGEEATEPDQNASEEDNPGKA